jgi:cell division protein FtsZ
MIEFEMKSPDAAPEAINVTVVGLGGSGVNVLDRIAMEGMPQAELICMASDVRVLNKSMAERKVQLGPALTQGLGAGGDPDLGLEAAQATEDEIRALFEGREMIFICTGLGGGTGSGGAPYITRLARESGAFVVVFATLPFGFEGRRRQKQALMALDELRQAANALVTFENDRMGELVVPKKGIQEAFLLADKVIGQSVRAVTNLVTQPGLIRIGMDDLQTALRNTDSRCLFGYGSAKGEGRALEALNLALKSPLLDRGELLSKAENVLVHICGGNNLTLHEVQTLMMELQKHVNEDAHLLLVPVRTRA